MLIFRHFPNNAYNNYSDGQEPRWQKMDNMCFGNFLTFLSASSDSVSLSLRVNGQNPPCVGSG